MNQPETAINVGILGCGVVGSGTLALLHDNAELIEQKVGARLRVWGVVDRNPGKLRRVRSHGIVLTEDPWTIVNAREVDIVVEAFGHIEPTVDYVLKAIENGKSVVTANKELVAKRGHEILLAAEQRGVDFLFEASVAGGIPLLHVVKECLAGNDIREVIGILNGTTNYILTRMSQGEGDFQQMLADAQRRGYAEKNPTADVDGEDAAYKLAILASIAFANRVRVEQVYREGISGVQSVDIRYASELGYVMKLLAIARISDRDTIELRVHPTLVPRAHPLAAVNDVFNAVLVRGDAAGDVMLYGQGAGALPSASSVVGDVMDAARNLRSGCRARINCTCFNDRPTQPMSEVVTRFYLRVKAKDQPGLLGPVATQLGEHGVSIAHVSARVLPEGQADMVMVTHEVREGSLRAALTAVEQLPIHPRIEAVYRVLGSSS